jgi:hypothetical protein
MLLSRIVTTDRAAPGSLRTRTVKAPDPATGADWRAYSDGWSLDLSVSQRRLEFARQIVAILLA